MDNENVRIEEINESLQDSFFDLRMKWSQQLKSLKGMGFLCDDEVLSLILEQVNGNLEEAVMVLLQQN